ncbi:protein NLRC3-like isoform X2 [Sardina pilchardus]|uniref:protein NLRC3-like isoform X2 n=1 Tax=Sardina pilchardus TaxID=27697 RepID=UPI002E13C2CE
MSLSEVKETDEASPTPGKTAEHDVDMDNRMSLTKERSQGDTDPSTATTPSYAQPSPLTMEINEAKAQLSELTHTSCFGQRNRSVSPVLSLISMKSSDSMMQPINIDGGTGHSDHRSVSPVPSVLSMKSSDSMMQPINIDGGTGHSDHRSVSPVPSVLSMKSSDSMMQPINIDGGTGHSDHSRSVSPVPSVLSMKSSDSMMQPINIDGGTGHSDHRSVSPLPSLLSMKSSDSMMQPINIDGGTGHSDHRSVSRVPSVLSMKSSDSMMQPINIDGGTGHFDHRDCVSADGDVIEASESTCALCSNSSRSPSPSHTVQPDNNSYSGSIKPEDNILETVKMNHKAAMKKRFEHVCEGNIKPGNKTPLNRIFTPLYITEGWTESLKAHEARQIETSRRQTQDSIINCNDIFKTLLEEKVCIRAVLTKGVAGIGKTVSVQKFILDWAEDKANCDIDFIFVLPFREMNLITNEQYCFHQLLVDFHPALKRLTDNKMYAECNLVVIFDGLDESRITLNFTSDQALKLHDVSKMCSIGDLITNLIQGNLLPSAHIWITSRPAAAGQIPGQFISRVTEVRGFTDQQKDEYFRKKISDQTQAKQIISHIKTSRSLNFMCHIPVVSWISSIVLQEVFQNNREEIPQTLTEIFTHFLIIQMNMKSQKFGEMEDGAPSSKVLEANKDVILKLAELAFTQLEKGNLLFYAEDLEECGIDVTEASVYSGLCTELFREEFVFTQKKVFCFVHLSIQEFLAALYAFYSYVNRNFTALTSLLTGWERQHFLETLLKDAVDKSLESEDGHWDMFVRFLLGLSLESNQRLLHGLLTHIVSSSESIEKTIKYTKEIIRYKDVKERCMNLLLCLLEMKDHSLHIEIQEYIDSGKDLSPSHCSVLAYIILVSQDALDEFDLQRYNTTSKGHQRLLEAVAGCRKARLVGCQLTVECFETVTQALESDISQLRELDLSYNDLQIVTAEALSLRLQNSQCKVEALRLVCCGLKEDFGEFISSIFQWPHSYLKDLDLTNNDLCDTGVEFLSNGLSSANCKVGTLRLSGCLITEKGCEFLSKALVSNHSHLKELDLSYNHLGDSGVELLSSQNMGFKLENLNVDHDGKKFLKPGLEKYAHELTLDPNTAHHMLGLSKGDTKAMNTKSSNSYLNHPERFEVFEQVLCREGVTGRAYWEVEWTRQGAAIAVAYRDMSRKGAHDSQFGCNNKSWCLRSHFWGNCVVQHNNKTTQVPIPKPNARQHRVGVYLDWQAGTLSFYQVCEMDTKIHLHTFTAKFTEPLYPGFWVDRDSSVSLCLID